MIIDPQHDFKPTPVPMRGPVCRRCLGFGKTISHVDCYKCGGTGIEQPPLSGAQIVLRILATASIIYAIILICS